jgi:hypothetical protein
MRSFRRNVGVFLFGAMCVAANSGCHQHHYYYNSPGPVCEPMVMQPSAGSVCEVPAVVQPGGGLFGGGGLFHRNTVVYGQPRPLVTRAGRPGNVVIGDTITSTPRDGWRQPDPEESLAKTSTKVESGGFSESTTVK